MLNMFFGAIIFANTTVSEGESGKSRIPYSSPSRRSVEAHVHTVSWNSGLWSKNGVGKGMGDRYAGRGY